MINQDKVTTLGKLLCRCYSPASFCLAIYDTNVHIHVYFVGVAYRAGVILASECSVFFLREIKAAIFDFNGSGKLGRKINFYQGGGRRSIIMRGVGVGEVPLPLPTTLTPNQIWPVG